MWHLTTGLWPTTCRVRSGTYKTNNQGDIKIEYDPRTSDKITGFFSISTAYDGKTALLGITFPGVNIISHQSCGC